MADYKVIHAFLLLSTWDYMVLSQEDPALEIEMSIHPKLKMNGDIKTWEILFASSTSLAPLSENDVVIHFAELTNSSSMYDIEILRKADHRNQTLYDKKKLESASTLEVEVKEISVDFWIDSDSLEVSLGCVRESHKVVITQSSYSTSSDELHFVVEKADEWQLVAMHCMELEHVTTSGTLSQRRNTSLPASIGTPSQRRSTSLPAAIAIPIALLLVAGFVVGIVFWRRKAKRKSNEPTNDDHFIAAHANPSYERTEGQAIESSDVYYELTGDAAFSPPTITSMNKESVDYGGYEYQFNIRSTAKAIDSTNRDSTVSYQLAESTHPVTDPMVYYSVVAPQQPGKPEQVHQESFTISDHGESKESDDSYTTTEQFRNREFEKDDDFRTSEAESNCEPLNSRNAPINSGNVPLNSGSAPLSSGNAPLDNENEYFVLDQTPEAQED